MKSPTSFAQRLLDWQKLHGRHSLPWQQAPTPYRVWISEIMLQQTQVATVIPYYQRFMARFPDVTRLAAAPLDDVLALWSGLGYYSRARNLHRCALAICHTHQGQWPMDLAGLMALPGIGEYTAGAILSICTDRPVPAMDGNVRRIMARISMEPEWPGSAAAHKRLMQHLASRLPDSEGRCFTQALFDLGSMVCRRSRPKCDRCPVSADCLAWQQDATDRYPLPRPRRMRPERNGHFLLAFRGQEVLMERSPDTGIWPGLWRLPWFDSPEALRSQAKTLTATEGLTLRHDFTHYRLFLTPWLTQVASDLPGRPDHWCWQSLNRLDDIGLPAPVRRLIEQNIPGDCLTAPGR
jgi:A/G-specific adenine glycosylase